MSKQIDETHKQYVMRCADIYATESGNKVANREALEQALEAALTPVAWRLWVTELGERPQWQYYDKSDFAPDVNPCDVYPNLEPLSAALAPWKKSLPGFSQHCKVEASLFGRTAAPPAQTPPPKGLFVDLIAQHPGLAEELKAIDDAPQAQTPFVEHKFGCHANAFGKCTCGAKTPPRWLTSDEITDTWIQVRGTLRGYGPFARAIETAVRKQLGVKDQEGGAA